MKKVLFGFILMSMASFLTAQCVPAPADYCQDANVFCSPNEMNGFTCKNADYSNPSGCNPLCPNGSSADNTSWWAFTSNGGNICITVTYSNCSVTGMGLQMGIWYDCNCSESITCDPSCTGPGNKVLCAVFSPCKTYYLFIDGCSGDVCDFTMSTSGGAPPQLPALTNITGPTNVCKGACNIKYGTSVNSGFCEPAFVWTLNGIQLDNYSKNIALDIPDEGDFILCVTAIIGNPKSGSICDQEGPKCITIKSRLEKDRLAGPRYLCFENIPYTWQGQAVIESGDYRQKFTDKTCCEYDSVVSFVVFAEPEIVNVFNLGCQGDFYKDPTTGKQYLNCQNGTRVTLTKKSNSYRCDSTYLLYSTFLDLGGVFNEFCQDGKTFCQFIAYDNTCKVNEYETEELEYKWYRKSDSLKMDLGNNTLLNIFAKDDYCVEITLKGLLNNVSKSCIFKRCETLDEKNLILDSICPKGPKEICAGEISKFFVDSLSPKDTNHIWSVTGGIILTQNSSKKRAIDILWSNPPPANPSYTGEVCYQLNVDSCLSSSKCCVKVKILGDPNLLNAGNDDQIKGIKYQLNAEPNSYGVWTKVNGPGNAFFSDINNSKSFVSVSRFGTYYFRWTITCKTSYSDDVQISFQKLIFNYGGSSKGIVDTCCINTASLTQSKEKIKPIYNIIPNPVRNGIIQVTGNASETSSQLFIYDLQGIKIMEKKLIWNSTFQDIELSPDLRSGIYYLYIQEEDGTIWPHKLIVIQ
ncbi:MAG: T9SS type A sorting domain-containing protein [Saprospiraceae bacterium]